MGINSNSGHVFSYFSKYDEKPFIIGGKDIGNEFITKVEILSEADQSWNVLADYPFGYE